MFDFDKWQEIFATIKQNKLRSALTMFGVYWGMFMLVILLGGGNGLERGAVSGFSAWASNAGFVWGQQTNKAFGGFQPGRQIRFKLSDIAAVESEVSGLELLAPRDQIGMVTVQYGVESDKFEVYGDYPAYFQIRKCKTLAGRAINELDIELARKSAYIGQDVAAAIFKITDENYEPAIGKVIKIRGFSFQVVGVFSSLRKGEDRNEENRSIHTAFTGFNNAFKRGEWSGWYAYSAREDISADKIEQDIKAVIAARHFVHPEDDQAIGSFSLGREFKEMQNLFLAIKLFVWMVSIGTLIAGLVGISNIMLIVVRERVPEIGIRKAMGAIPSSIIALVVQESVFLTTIAGGIGIGVAQLILALIRTQMPEVPGPNDMFDKPYVNLEISLIALSILVIGGAIAGLVPAIKAAKVSPIEAIRAE